MLPGFKLVKFIPIRARARYETTRIYWKFINTVRFSHLFAGIIFISRDLGTTKILRIVIKSFYSFYSNIIDQYTILLVSIVCVCVCEDIILV